MYTVKRLEKDTPLSVTKTGRASVIRRTPNVCYAVVNERGEVVKDYRGYYEIYNLRQAAEKQAAHLNENNPEGA